MSGLIDYYFQQSHPCHMYLSVSLLAVFGLIRKAVLAVKSPRNVLR